jgi:hypothetical protein
MRSTAIVSALVVVLAVTGCGGGGSSSKSSYVKKNDSIQKKLPLYPGAKLTKTATSAYSASAGKIVGYQTRYIYGLPTSATTSKVEAFYLKNMPSDGWKQVASLTGPVLNYRKGDAFVSVNLAEVPSHQLEHLVDSAFFSHVAK